MNGSRIDHARGGLARMIMLAVVVLAVALAGCKTEPEFTDSVIPYGRDIELTQADDGSTVEFEVGRSFAVLLEVEYPGRWQWAGEASAQAGEPWSVTQLAADYTPPVDDRFESVTGTRTWECVFEVVSEGSDLLVLEEFGDGGERTGRQWTVTVVVGDAAAAADTPRTDPFVVDAIAIAEGLEAARESNPVDEAGDLAEYRALVDEKADSLAALLGRAKALDATGEDAAIRADLVYVLELESSLADDWRGIARDATSIQAAEQAFELRNHDFEEEWTESSDRHTRALVALELER